MNNTQPINFLDLNRDHQSDVHRIAYIKSFSLRTGEQAGKLLSDFLSGILYLFLERSGSVQSPAVSKNSGNLMTAYEIAIILNISKAKAYQLISKGEIPSVHFGRTTRVRPQDLEEFLKDHIVHTNISNS